MHILQRKFIFSFILFALTACTSDKNHRTSSTGATPKHEPISKYGNPTNYKVNGKKYTIKDSSQGYKETGVASWYGKDFHGKRTSSGTPYNMHNYSAAHKTLPIPTYVRVTNLENKKSVIVRVDDRGPFAKGRIIDLSYQAAKDLDMIAKGTANVRVEALSPYQSRNNREAIKMERIDVFSDSRGDVLEVISTPSIPSLVGGYHTLQLNAFSTKLNAKNFQDQMKAIENLETDIHYDGKYYRVVTNRYDSQYEAEIAAQQLKRNGRSVSVFYVQ